MSRPGALLLAFAALPFSGVLFSGALFSWVPLAAAAEGPAPADGLPAFDCAGPFAADAREARLKDRFGAGSVVFRTVNGPEGTTHKASVLFARDRARRVEVVWKDERRRRPGEVSVGPGSAWRTPEGVGVGSSLAEVEAANGRPFVLAGFGWDYGGSTLDWKGGRLGRDGCRLLLRFEPVAIPSGDVDGDRDIASDDPAMRAAQPVVYQMLLLFE